VLGYAEGNQSRAADILGINRGTLRKKLKNYGISG
jgi:Fis family transcriptional regulator